MDVDNDPIDSNLLLQFTCLNTTDRDDLVKQFKELIDEVNDDTAAFFLEMNNWNLQNAICAFLDYRSPKNEYSMVVTLYRRKAELITPNAEFVMEYVLRNDGREAWPQGCSLICTCGNFAYPERFPVDAIEPGNETSVPLLFTAPSEPGDYFCTLRLASPSGVYFGNTINASFEVLAKLDDGELQRLSDELETRMALIDNTDSKVMEDDSSAETSDVVSDPFSNSIGMDQRNVTDFNQDHNIS